MRAANGMHTAYLHVWDGLIGDTAMSLDHDLLIASPPCQAFSMAGKGAGRKALDDVIEAIDERLYLDPERLRGFADGHGDDRIALVLTPLAHVARDAPTYVVFEQVPPVLPVWERCAVEMQKWGYSVWTGYLQAEQYGVPQTRKRAILIARADGKVAKAPTPTHSRYYSRDPHRLDEGVKPWVSMAQALGWGMTERPMVTAGNAIGRAEGIGGSGGKAAILREQAKGAWLEDGRPGFGIQRVVRSNYGTSGDPENRGERTESEPSATITSKAGRNAVLERPAPTVTGGGAATGGAEVFGRHGRAIIEKMHLDPYELTATVAGDQATRATRVSVAEAAILQSYPADFIWDAEIDDPKTGRRKPITKTNQFLQIGNAVPPLLAEAILREVLS